MHGLELPLPLVNVPPAFQDVAGARDWLKTQPEAEAMHMLRVLAEQVQAIDAAPWPPETRRALIDALRPAIIVVQAASEVRYLRKPLPMATDDENAFLLAQQLWTVQAVAMVRIARAMQGTSPLPPLHRAAIATRMAMACHFQAAREVPAFLRQLLGAILDAAVAAQVLALPLRDPDFPVFGESPLSGQLAWACLLLAVDPYHLSVAQLTVTNRAFSRWRDLGGFLAEPDPDPRARAIPLARLVDGGLTATTPGWLDVRPVTRKLRQRIEALRQGATPESLKLGRELSSEACVRLLQDLDAHLRLKVGTTNTEVGERDLAFGAEDCYALFAQEYLNPKARSLRMDRIAHQRMEIFGFDRVSQLSNAVKRVQLDVPFERWLMVDGEAVRAADAGARRMTPCLVGTVLREGPRLGVMMGLRTGAEGRLQARVHWYQAPVSAATLAQEALGPGQPAMPRQAVFLLEEPAGLSILVAPSAGVRLNGEVRLAGARVSRLVPFEVLERGVDFVRYACAPV